MKVMNIPATVPASSQGECRSCQKAVREIMRPISPNVP
jgi:hypothetical protein